jgi:lycopene cyclase domain-containing protein
MAQMRDEAQYLALMAGCLIVTLPLELVLGARVWRRPARLVRALVPTVVVFTVWDIVAIDRGHWTFNPRYVTGWRLPGNLPIEELVFFFVVPICGLLTLEAVRTMLRRQSSSPEAALAPEEAVHA